MQLEGPETDEIALGVAVLWNPDRSACGGLGAKGLRVLKDIRRTGRLGGSPSAVSALSGGMAMWFRARSPSERLTSRIVLLWQAGTAVTLVPCWFPYARADVEVH